MQPRTVYLIKRVEAEITERMARTINPFGVTPLQFSILSFMEQEGHSFSSAQLSRRFKMTPQSMNEAVAILQKKDLIIKTTAPENKRILRLGLTEKGKTTLGNCNAAIDALEADLFSELSQKQLENSNELTVLRSLLGKILAKTK